MVMYGKIDHRTHKYGTWVTQTRCRVFSALSFVQPSRDRV